MSKLAEQFITEAEYLNLESMADTKNEYFNGCIYATSGASRSHNRITVNLGAMLHSQLKDRPCEPFVGDMRVKVNPTGLYTYPDVVVVCGDAQFEIYTLLNHTVIFEVLSSSTEIYDRVDKFAHYRRLESLTDYLLVSQDQPRIEHYHRHIDAQWLYIIAEGLDSQIEIPSINCVLPLRGSPEMYRITLMHIG